MLIHLDISPFLIIHKLAHSSIKFYLTGSRFFGYSHPSSDWDFFTQTDPQTKAYLERTDFKRVPMHPSWLSDNCDGIWRHPSHVEVAFATNVDLQRKAQIYLRDICPNAIESMRVAGREKRLKMWNNLYKIILDTMLDGTVKRTIETALTAENRPISFMLEDSNVHTIDD